jgi:hypothetical protein
VVNATAVRRDEVHLLQEPIRVERRFGHRHLLALARIFVSQNAEPVEASQLSNSPATKRAIAVVKENRALSAMVGAVCHE